MSSCKNKSIHTYRGMRWRDAARRRPGSVTTNTKTGIAMMTLDRRQTVVCDNPYKASAGGNNEPAVTINPARMKVSMK